MVPASLVGYIEKLSSGTLNLIKYLKQDQLESVCGADIHQDLMSLSTGLMVLKQNVGNNIQGYFLTLWSAVNILEEHLDQKIFGITSLKNVVVKLNIIFIQRKITKSEATVKMLNMQMQQKFEY